MYIAGSDGFSDNISPEEIEGCAKHWEKHHPGDRDWLLTELRARAIYNAKSAMHLRQKLCDNPHMRLTAEDKKIVEFYKGADDISLIVGFCCQ